MDIIDFLSRCYKMQSELKFNLFCNKFFVLYLCNSVRYVNELYSLHFLSVFIHILSWFSGIVEIKWTE